MSGEALQENQVTRLLDNFALDGFLKHEKTSDVVRVCGAYHGRLRINH
jgi:hypothetical protein